MILMNDVKRFFSNPGSKVKTVYSPKLDKDGSIDLVPVGEENIQDFIDSFSEDTSISIIIAKCAAGDTSALSKRQGMYGDFSDIPKSFRDILQTVIDGQKYFDSLDVDIKNKFDNSFEKWFSLIGTEEWNSIMNPSPVEVNDEEVR